MACLIGVVVGGGAVREAPGALMNLVVNGDFSSGLAGWTTESGVLESSGFAVLPDLAFGGSALFQSVDVRESGETRFALRFSVFADGMASVVPPGTLPDTGFGTLYAGGEAFGLTIAGSGFAEVRGFFDLDSDGMRGLPAGAEVVPRIDRPGWAEVAFEFESGQSHLTLAFELLGENGVAGDSVLAVDDVALFAIPEPSVEVLAGLVAGVIGMARRRTRREEHLGSGRCGGSRAVGESVRDDGAV